MVDTILSLFPFEAPQAEQRRLKPTDAAYVAGLIDGDGCIALRGMRNPRGFVGFVTLAMTSKELLEEMALLAPWGRCNIGMSDRPGRGQRRNRTSWRITWAGQNCVRMCKALLPYIRLKRPHVELILSVDAAKKKAIADSGGKIKPPKPYPAWVRAYEIRVVEQFRILNARGQDHEPSSLEISATVGRNGAEPEA